MEHDGADDAGKITSRRQDLCTRGWATLSAGLALILCEASAGGIVKACGHDWRLSAQGVKNFLGGELIAESESGRRGLSDDISEGGEVGIENAAGAYYVKEEEGSEQGADGDDGGDHGRERDFVSEALIFEEVHISFSPRHGLWLRG